MQFGNKVNAHQYGSGHIKWGYPHSVIQYNYNRSLRTKTKTKNMINDLENNVSISENWCKMVAEMSYKCLFYTHMYVQICSATLNEKII